MRVGETVGVAIPESTAVAPVPVAAAPSALAPDAYSPSGVQPPAGVPLDWKRHLPGPLRYAAVVGDALTQRSVAAVVALFHPPAPPPNPTESLARSQAILQAMAHQTSLETLPKLAVSTSSQPLAAKSLVQQGKAVVSAVSTALNVANQVYEVWPQGQAIAASLDVALSTGNYGSVNDLMKQLSLYQRGGAYAPGVFTAASPRYYDDNLWLGLDFLQAYQQTGNQDYLQHAEALFPFFEGGLSPAGGLHWVEKSAHMSRNTCSNGPAVEYALRLYQATRDPKYLTFAENCQTFLDTQMRSPEGLYYDNLGDDGHLDQTIYSYNQGTPIGADVLFYRITGDRHYLDQATQTAKAALAYFAQDDRLWKQSPAFNAIFFRNLLALDAVAPDPSYRQALNDYLARVWQQGRDPQTGLISQGGIGSYQGPGSYLDQGGLAQLFALSVLPEDKLLDVA